MGNPNPTSRPAPVPPRPWHDWVKGFVVGLKAVGIFILALTVGIFVGGGPIFAPWEKTRQTALSIFVLWAPLLYATCAGGYRGTRQMIVAVVMAGLAVGYVSVTEILGDLNSRHPGQEFHELQDRAFARELIIRLQTVVGLHLCTAVPLVIFVLHPRARRRGQRANAPRPKPGDGINSSP